MPENTNASQLFEIRPSRSATKLLRLLQVLALIGCWLNSLPEEYRIAIGALLIGLIIIPNRYRNESAMQLRYTPNNNWLLRTGQDNDFFIITILSSTTITDWAIFLHYKTNSQLSGALLIAKDSLMADSFRRLKVRLKLSESQS